MDLHLEQKSKLPVGHGYDFKFKLKQEIELGLLTSKASMVTTNPMTPKSTATFTNLKVIAETNLEALISCLIVAVMELDLRHEDVSIRVSRIFVQTML